eukprot:1658007-Amphidinium_carterae.1
MTYDQFLAWPTAHANEASAEESKSVQETQSPPTAGSTCCCLFNVAPIWVSRIEEGKLLLFANVGKRFDSAKKNANFQKPLPRDHTYS